MTADRDPVGDASLIRRANDGDGGALESLLRRHHDRIFAICRKLAGNDADAADATQEALLAIVRGLPRFDGRATFSTWSYRVATNACLDELRRRSRRPDPGLPEWEEAERGGPPSLDQQVSDRVVIDAALQGLPIEFRAAVVLRDQAGLDYAEISEVLDIPPGTVRSRIARGRAALAKEIAVSRQLHGNQDPSTERPTGAS